MTRIDLIILSRIASRIFLTLLIFYGLILLVESIDNWRYSMLASIGGWQFAAFGMFAAAAGWLMRALPLIVLVGTAIGVIDLQSRRELTAVKAAGMSIWRILRAPTVAILLAGLVITFYGEGLVTSANRLLDETVPIPDVTPSLTPSAGLWLEQVANGERYILQASHVTGSGQQLQGVTIFLPDGLNEGRILAPAAKLVGGAWLMPTATRYRAGLPPLQLVNFSMPTDTTPSDLRLKINSTDDMTLFELASSLAGNMSDTQLRNAAMTRFLRLLSLPVLLVGSLFIAFAFTAGYRRARGYGGPIIYSILIGFVVFVISEMADRAGSAGVLSPMFAACGPAFVALVIGLTVLLYKEDGWA
ncbi:MAG TPA: LptF/LptG family permease [Devosiaceae bacterium]|jgi:lipopolysaccharide export system permease protein|nr:LptF/LptG family permease [Devosiaceae bacterium]